MLEVVITCILAPLAIAAVGVAVGLFAGIVIGIANEVKKFGK